MTKPARQELSYLRLFTGAQQHDNLHRMGELVDTRPMAPWAAPTDWARRHAWRRARWFPGRSP